MNTIKNAQNTIGKLAKEAQYKLQDPPLLKLAAINFAKALIPVGLGGLALFLFNRFQDKRVAYRLFNTIAMKGTLARSILEDLDYKMKTHSFQ